MLLSRPPFSPRNSGVPGAYLKAGGQFAWARVKPGNPARLAGQNAPAQRCEAALHLRARAGAMWSSGFRWSAVLPRVFHWMLCSSWIPPAVGEETERLKVTIDPTNPT